MNRMTEQELIQFVDKYGDDNDLYAYNELGVPEEARKYLVFDNECGCTYNVGQHLWETAMYQALYIDEDNTLQVVLFYNLGKEYDDAGSEFDIYPFSSLLLKERQTIIHSLKHLQTS